MGPGDILKNARIEKKITLIEINRQTKIPLKSLEAIENNEFEKLPGDVFARGFIRSYSKLVDIPEQQAIEAYVQLFQDQKGLDGTVATNSDLSRVLISTSGKSAKRKKSKIYLVIIIFIIFSLAVSLIISESKADSKWPFFNSTSFKGYQKAPAKSASEKGYSSTHKAIRGQSF